MDFYRYQVDVQDHHFYIYNIIPLINFNSARSFFFLVDISKKKLELPWNGRMDIETDDGKNDYKNVSMYVYEWQNLNLIMYYS